VEESKSLCTELSWGQYNYKPYRFHDDSYPGTKSLAFFIWAWRYHLVEGDMMSTSTSGMNEGHFTLIIPTSSYIWEPGAGWLNRLWIKCYCVQLEVIPISHRWPQVGGGHCRPIWENMGFGWECYASQRWVLWGHGVLTCNMSSSWFLGCLQPTIWYIYPNVIRKQEHRQISIPYMILKKCESLILYTWMIYGKNRYQAQYWSLCHTLSKVLSAYFLN
jgi:hypothetical protein